MNQQIKTNGSLFISFDFDLSFYLFTNEFLMMLFNVRLDKRKKLISCSSKTQNMKINCGVDKVLIISKKITNFNKCDV